MDEAAATADEADDRLRTIGGGFRARTLEAAFEAERLFDSRRHARFLFCVSALLNTGFLAIDWRFVGTPQFWIAVPARLAVIATSLICLLLVRRAAGAPRLTATLIGWMAGTAIGVALLVTSRSTLAQFVVLMLPVAYYLAVPVAFGWLVAGGAGCSALLLIGYCWRQPMLLEDLGLVLAALTLNVALAMSVTRSNGLARRAWLSARSAQRLGAALASSRVALERMFFASPVPLMLITADGSARMLAMSRSCATLLGDETPATLRQFYVPDGAIDPLPAALAAGGGSTELEVTATLAGGAQRTFVLKAATIALPERDAILTGILDITERRAAQINLEQIASTDALTGLRNRMSFFSAARAEMLRAVRMQTPLCLLMIDIDHFKAINDTHGHSAGDAVLRNFAAVCADALGTGAIVARLGGEEFGVLLPDTAPAAAKLRAERLREAVAGARTASGETHIAITISIGIARVLPLERDLDQALARADLALYGAKRNGRNRVAAEDEGGWLRARA